jgi:uncharacterized protein (TIGR02301 family)
VRRLVIVAAILLAVQPMALAQQRTETPTATRSRGEAKPAAKPAAKSAAKPTEAKPAPAAAPAEPKDVQAPYDRDLTRLAEIMGSLAFLRTLCKASDAGEWRNRMKGLVDAEGQTDERKNRLAGAYNRGFQNFSLTYRQCTPSANEAIERYLAEGQNLQRTIASRFGG